MPESSSHPILFVLTGHTRLGDSGQPTGWHASEVTHPFSVFSDAGYDIKFASPGGGKTFPDPGSVDFDDPQNWIWLNDPDWMARTVNTLPVSTLDASDYAAVYFPGGHGTMWDLPDHEGVQHLIRDIWEQGKPVGAVCHGPAALVNTTLSDGSYLVDGKCLAAFTDEEERAVDKDDIVPFLLASKLEQRGAEHQGAGNFESQVVVDGQLVTGQNPASARPLAEAMLELLSG